MGEKRVVDAERVLVIEDDAGLRAAYLRILTATGFAAEGCESGERALERLQRGERYSVVVTDLVMSGMPGTDLLPLIQQFDPDLPVVILTGRPSLRSTIAAVEHQSFRYLLKPVSPKVLSETVRAAAGRYQLASLKRRALELSQTDGWRSAAGSIEECFKSAIERVFMVYQPIVASDGSVFGYEALVRTEELAFRGPDELFVAAERLGRVQDLGRVIRAQVSRDVEQAPPGCNVFVNLHANDLADAELYSESSPLTQHASRVVLEVTERKSLDGIADLRSRLAELRKLGYRIAVDDLGAGYAGLSCFNMLEPEIVKLDMSLIRDIDTQPRKLALVDSMIRVCQRDLGMLVVCEGVETLPERDLLLELDAALLQGYLLGRPQRGFDYTAGHEWRSEERLIAGVALRPEDEAESA